MMARPLVGICNYKKYEDNCAEYDEIIEMFRELGSGKQSRRDVLNNIRNMVENGLVERLDNIVEEIEDYEEWS